MNATSNNDIKSTRAARGGSVGYTTVANAMPASREAAPYLGQTHVSGSYTQDDVAERIASSKGAQCGVEEVKRVLNAVGNYLIDRMPEELCSIDIGFAHVRPALGGQFPSMDSPFDAERNRIFVCVTLSDEIRNAMADGTPTRMGGDDGEPMIGNVVWNSASKTIKSGEEFRVLGNALTMDVGDESAELRLPGEVEPVPVALVPEEAFSWQRLVGRLAHAVDPCEGAILVIRTHGSDRKSSLKDIVFKGITILAGEAAPLPTLTDVYTREDEPGTIMQDEAFQLIGTNLTLGEGGKVETQLADTEAHDTWYDLTGNASNLDAERIRLSDLAWETLVQDVHVGTEHSRVRFRVTIGGKFAEIVATAAMA